MKCVRCGAIVDGKAFCPQCAMSVSQTNGQRSRQTLGNPGSVLAFGIVSMALCGLVIGVLFGFIGLSQANLYNRTYGPVSNQVNIGKSLSISGIILGTVCLVLYGFLLIMLVANRGSIVT